jgi:peptidyl-tRNA hydrolase
MTNDSIRTTCPNCGGYNCTPSYCIKRIPASPPIPTKFIPAVIPIEKNNINKSKMYILIKDDPIIDLGHVVLASAHASLSGYLTFVDNEFELNPTYDGMNETEQWARESFRKVICKVTNKEFEKAKTYGENMKDYRIMVESGLGGMEVAIVFKPCEGTSFLKSLKLYK